MHYTYNLNINVKPITLHSEMETGNSWGIGSVVPERCPGTVSLRAKQHSLQKLTTSSRTCCSHPFPGILFSPTSKRLNYVTEPTCGKTGYSVVVCIWGGAGRKGLLNTRGGEAMWQREISRHWSDQSWALDPFLWKTHVPLGNSVSSLALNLLIYQRRVWQLSQLFRLWFYASKLLKLILAI